MYVVVVVTVCKLLRGPVNEIEKFIVENQVVQLESGEREGRRGLLESLDLAGGGRGGSLGDRIWTCMREVPANNCNEKWCGPRAGSTKKFKLVSAHGALFLESSAGATHVPGQWLIWTFLSCFAPGAMACCKWTVPD